jgi:glutamate carboxypeptidase
VRAQAQREKQPLLDTLQQLVSIESGSGDVEGVTRIGLGIAERLRALGGSVDLVKPAADMPRITSVPEKFADTVVARFRGRGTARILLLAHMDTVYERGMLTSRFASTAIAPTASALPTTSTASPSSSTHCRC